MKTVRVGLIAIGALGMAYAVLGALTDADVKGGVLLFLIGVLVLHDAILLPLTVVGGALVGRFAPLRLRALVRAALLISLSVTIVAFPLVLRRGPAADNSSLLPLQYGRGLAEIYSVIWSATGVAVAVRTRRSRLPRSPGVGEAG